jgi:hypothetical protein
MMDEKEMDIGYDERIPFIMLMVASEWSKYSEGTSEARAHTIHQWVEGKTNLRIESWVWYYILGKYHCPKK